MKRHPHPLTQGDVSGDCVIYSAMNAVRYLWPRTFRKHEACEKLFEELVSKMRDRMVNILIEGSDTEASAEVAALMVPMLKERGLALTFEPMAKGATFATPPDFARWLRQRLSMSPKGRSVAIIGLDEPWDHWTVVTGVSSKPNDPALRFYDSYAVERLKKLRISAFSVAASGEDKKRIRIDVAGSVIYRRGDADEAP